MKDIWSSVEFLKIVTIISMNCYLENFVQITIINKFFNVSTRPTLSLSPCIPSNIRAGYDFHRKLRPDPTYSVKLSEWDLMHNKLVCIDLYWLYIFQKVP